VGWREWLALPELPIPAIKAKIDTGARTSALHTFRLETFRHHGRDRVRFWVHPLQRRLDLELYCEADILDQRVVTDSGGHRERRIVINTPIRLGEVVWPVEISLTNRDTMMFRMLLGRTALRKRFVVDAGASFVAGRTLAKIYSGERPSEGKKR
jgi:hypothetical protein